MSDELKYCKFCDKTKPKKEFCKSGFAIKNICRECQNKKQKEKLNANKNWNELKKFVEERIKFLQEEKAEFEEDLYNNYETNNAEITIRRCNLTQLEDVQEKMQELENRKV